MMRSPCGSRRPLRISWSWVFALIVSVPGLSAQRPRLSAPITDVRYEITADSATVGARELVAVMDFHVANAAPVMLALPAWSPGHYELLWFARRVSRFSADAEGGGPPLEWHKLDFQTWEIKPRAAGRVRVSFHYAADAVDRAVAWTSPQFAFFNGTNVFLYPVGRGFDWPARVTVHTEPSWRVVTPMDPRTEPRTYSATNYHDLVDMPFYVGRFDVDSALIADRWFRVAMYPAGALTPARRDRTFGWLRRIVPQQVAIFGEAPFRTYTIFVRSDTIVNGGGLEHQSSQVDEVHITQLDAEGLHGLYAHELFHAWNVKRLRPADLVPYRYDDAQPTPWLWVSEGITDYYGFLSLTRSGIVDSSTAWRTIGIWIGNIEGVPPTAPADASLSAWIGVMDGSAGLYYAQGDVAALLLDILIRDASDNRHSLDGVMRHLYETTYKHGRGFTRADWWSAVKQAAGAPGAGGSGRSASTSKSFDEFARRYIEGREPFPVDSLLPLAGLRVERIEVREPRIGIATATDSTGVTVTYVDPTGAGAAAGLRAGDVFVSVGDVTVRNEASFVEFRSRYAGTSTTVLPLVVRRDGQALTLQLPVRLVPRNTIRVVPDEHASDKAVAIRRGILG